MPSSNEDKKDNNDNDTHNPMQRKRKDTATSTTTTSTTGEQMYHPSIFRYQCRGKLDLSTKITGSAGTCWGVQSQLEHVDHWRLVTRQEAVKVFSEQAGGGPEEALPAGNDAAAAHALSTTLLSQVLIYSRDKKSLDDDHVGTSGSTNPSSPSPNKVQPAVSVSVQEEIIASQDWTCYGSSEIDLLVLRPQGEKEEEIVAVAPYCSPGLSVRDVRGDLGNDRTSTLRLGFLEVVYQSANPLEQDQEQEQGDHNTHNGQEDVKPKQMLTQEAVTAAAVSFPRKFYHSSCNIVTHMQANANLLADSVKEDFPQRTFAASQRIVGEFGKTLERSTSLMKKLAQLWDDDDDNDNEKK